MPLYFGNSKIKLAGILSDTTFADTSSATLSSGDQLLEGVTAYSKGVKYTGNISDNGDVSATIDGLETTSVIIPAGKTSGGTVSLTDDIEKALAAI